MLEGSEFHCVGAQWVNLLAKGFCSNMGDTKYSCVKRNEAAWKVCTQ